MINFYSVVIKVNNKQKQNQIIKMHDKIKVNCNQCVYNTTFEMLLNNSYLGIHGRIQYLSYKCKYQTGIDMRVKKFETKKKVHTFSF